MARVLQEFYCGECDGYFHLNLNMSLNYEVEVQCPNEKCKHLHRRCVVEGQIYEQGRFRTEVKEKLIASDATYSKTPMTQKMRDAHEKKYGGRRDGVPIERDPLSQEEFNERWASLASKQG